MIIVLTSLALASALSLPHAQPRPHTGAARPIARAIAGVASSPALASSPAPAFQNGSHDSVKNGLIIGAVAGGVLGALGGAMGCGYGEILDTFPDDEDSCTGPTLAGALIGAGLGSLLGAGVDALFDRAPYAGAGPGARRTGVRVRWRF